MEGFTAFSLRRAGGFLHLGLSDEFRKGGPKVRGRITVNGLLVTVFADKGHYPPSIS